MAKKTLLIDLGREGISKVEIDPQSPIEDWPIEVKLEFLNMILILYNLGLLSKKVYLEKYAHLVEQYAIELNNLLEFVEYKKKY